MAREASPDGPWKTRTTVILIWKTVKAELDIFLEMNPEVKLTYFVSDAILEKITREKLKNQLTETSNTQS